LDLIGGWLEFGARIRVVVGDVEVVVEGGCPFRLLCL